MCIFIFYYDIICFVFLMSFGSIIKVFRVSVCRWQHCTERKKKKAKKKKKTPVASR